MEIELLKPEELDAHVQNGTFRLAFVGMSNAGKSYRSKVLQNELNFVWFHVDEKIQHELGFESMEDISAWLGYPTEDSYAQREARYLEFENKFTKQASMKVDGQNLVFDTTGSVVHLEQDTLQTLQENTLVVHLDVGDDSLSELVEKFFEHPKPVAWCGHLTQKEGETPEEAVRRSYPQLLKLRLEQYRSLAHVNILARDVYDTSALETLDVIKDSLTTRL